MTLRWKTWVFPSWIALGRRQWLAGALVLLAGMLGLVAAPISRAAEPLLPVVFVHGQSGSAQQFETQAMRFTSNGYPQEVLFAFEYDTSQATNPLADLDDFIDGLGKVFLNTNRLLKLCNRFFSIQQTSSVAAYT